MCSSETPPNYLHTCSTKVLQWREVDGQECACPLPKIVGIGVPSFCIVDFVFASSSMLYSYSEYHHTDHTTSHRLNKEVLYESGSCWELTGKGECLTDIDNGSPKNWYSRNVCKVKLIIDLVATRQKRESKEINLTTTPPYVGLSMP